MSDEFEDISVDVSTDVAPVETIEAPVAPVADSTPAPEQPDADQKTFDNSTKIGSAEDVIRQDMAEENGAAIGNGDREGRAPLTAQGREKAEEEKQKAKDALIEQMDQAAKHREDFLNKEHEFGGMKMSGHDLEKLLNFISNPQMQDKLRERLGKSGMSKDKVDKGMKELNEYAELKKKEKDGALTEEQQRRLKEINKSEEFKAVTVAVAQQLKNDGINLSGDNAREAIVAKTADASNTGTAASNQVVENNNNSAVDASKSKKTAESQAGMQAAYAHFSTAPHLGDEFASKVAVGKVIPAANDMSAGFEATTPAAVVAHAKPKVVVDLSFG